MTTRSQAPRIAFLEAQVERLTALVEKLTVPQPRVQPVRVAADPEKPAKSDIPDIVLEAINARSFDKAATTLNYRYAAQMLARGVDQNDVAAAIMGGHRLDHDPLEIPD